MCIELMQGQYESQVQLHSGMNLERGVDKAAFLLYLRKKMGIRLWSGVFIWVGRREGGLRCNAFPVVLYCVTHPVIP